jgi:Pvc16 N-terminal domain
VLADVDLSLAAWLSAALPPRTEIDFGPPASRASERTTRRPAVNVFLHAVDEDTSGLRASEIRLRDENGRASGIMLPIRRYALTYLLTAWAGDPLAEHRLLGTVLLAHAGHDHLAGEHLRGALAETGECLPVHIGRAGHEVRWDRLGLPGHNGIVLTVLAPAVPQLAQIIAPPVEQIELVARTKPHRTGRDVAPDGDEPSPRWRRTTHTEP